MKAIQYYCHITSGDNILTSITKYLWCKRNATVHTDLKAQLIKGLVKEITQEVKEIHKNSTWNEDTQICFEVNNS